MKRLTAWANKENIGLAKAQPSKRGGQGEYEFTSTIGQYGGYSILATKK